MDGPLAKLFTTILNLGLNKSTHKLIFFTYQMIFLRLSALLQICTINLFLYLPDLKIFLLFLGRYLASFFLLYI